MNAHDMGIVNSLTHIATICQESKSMPTPVILCIPVNTLLEKMKSTEEANQKEYENALASYNKLLSELTHIAKNNKCKITGGVSETYAFSALDELGYMRPVKPKSLSGFISRLELSQMELLEIEDGHEMLKFLDQE